MNQKAKKTPLTNSNFGGMGWVLVIFYFFALFMDVGLTADGAQIMIPALAEANNQDQTTLMYFNTIAGYIALAAYIPLGIWAQKSSPKTQASILSVMAGIAYILLGRATNIVVYAVCLAVVVICSNGRCWISYAKLTSNWFPRKKGIVMGWTTIGNNASSMLMIPPDGGAHRLRRREADHAGAGSVPDPQRRSQPVPREGHPRGVRPLSR